jgi:hypothetical protein
MVFQKGLSLRALPEFLIKKNFEQKIWKLGEKNFICSEEKVS